MAYFIDGFTGATMEEARAKADAAYEKRKADGLASAEKHKARVVRVADNGEYLSVRFVRDDGEEVQGRYQCVGWEKAPATYLNKIRKAERKAIIAGSPVVTWKASKAPGSRPESQERKPRS